MSLLIDRKGHRYGRLFVVESAWHPNGKKRGWVCKCDCGNVTFVMGTDLKRGFVQSCGCWKDQSTRQRNTKHGAAEAGKKTKEYLIWVEMRARCNNPNNANYHRYGGRGIKVCDRWSEGFQNFLDDMGPQPFARASIDRIDNDKGYEPDNCRWAGYKTQSRNRSTNIQVQRSDGLIFRSTVDADEMMGVARGSVWNAASGFSKTSAGFTWKRLDGKNEPTR